MIKKTENLFIKIIKNSSLRNRYSLAREKNILIVSTIIFLLFTPSSFFAQTAKLSEKIFISKVEQAGVFLETDKRLSELRSRTQSVTSLFSSPLEIEAGYQSGSPFNDPDRGFSAGISQEIDLYGKKSLRYHTADAGLRKDIIEMLQTKREYLRDLRTLFLNAYILNERLRISDSLASDAEKLASAATLRKEKGDISPFEFNSITLEYLKERSSNQALYAEQVTALTAIRTRFGVDLSNSVLEIDSTEEELQNLLYKPDLYASIVDTLPEIQLKNAEIEILNYQRSLVSKEQFSNPNIGVSFMQNRLTFGQSDITGNPVVTQNISGIQKDERQLGFKLSFSLPFSIPLLWQAGEYLTLPYDGAIAAKRLEIQQFRKSLTADLQSAVTRTQYLDSAQKTLQAARTMIAANYSTLERAYRLGQLSLNDFLLNKRILNEILQNSLDAEKRYHESRILLLYLINK